MDQKWTIKDYEDLIKVLEFAFDPHTRWTPRVPNSPVPDDEKGREIEFYASSEACQIRLAAGRNVEANSSWVGVSANLVTEQNGTKSVEIPSTLVHGLFAAAMFEGLSQSRHRGSRVAGGDN